MADLEQEWNKTRKTEPTEDVFTYKYYVIEDIDLVRVKLSSRGFEIGAERVDLRTGQLKRDNAVLRRVDLGPYVEEIDQTRFEELHNELCKHLLQKKNDGPGIGNLP